MTWLQIDVLEFLFRGATPSLVGLLRPFQSRAMNFEEARAAVAARRHLEAIRMPHPLSILGGRTYNHLI